MAVKEKVRATEMRRGLIREVMVVMGKVNGVIM